MKELQGAEIHPWQFIKPGEPVEIIFPCAPPNSKEHLSQTKHVLEEYGLNIICDENALDPQKAPFQFYANTLKKRVQNFIDALEGPARVLWAFRGRFGAVEVIDQLEILKYTPPKIPKLVVGFSDVTHFHGLVSKWGWTSLHAPVAGIAQETYGVTRVETNKLASLKSVVDVLTGKIQKLQYEFEVLYHPNPSLDTIISGSVMGGNATLVKDMQHTSTAMPSKGRFIFLEDTREDPKRLNRVLVSLLRTGFFDEAKAIIFGHLPIMGAQDQREASLANIKLFVEDHLKPHGLYLPVLYGADFGHGEENEVLPFGTAANLSFQGKKAILNVQVAGRSFAEE